MKLLVNLIQCNNGTVFFNIGYAENLAFHITFFNVVESYSLCIKLGFELLSDYHALKPQIWMP